MSSTTDSNRKKLSRGVSWVWLCPQCIQTKQINLHDHQITIHIQVWWYDDEQSYYGLINAFDELTQKYRILYEDNEWEFISLNIEPVLFLSSDLNQIINT